MAFRENEIPILEYDDSPSAVVMPTHENLDIQLPKKAVFAFLGDVIEQYASAVNAEKTAELLPRGMERNSAVFHLLHQLCLLAWLTYHCLLVLLQVLNLCAFLQKFLKLLLLLSLYLCQILNQKK